MVSVPRNRRRAVAGDRPGLDIERHVERGGIVVGNDVAAGDGGERPPFLLQAPHDLGFGLEDRVRTGVAARE